MSSFFLYLLIIFVHPTPDYETIMGRMRRKIDRTEDAMRNNELELANENVRIGRKMFKRATKIDDQNPQAYINYALLLSAAAKYSKAAKFWQKVEKIMAPNSKIEVIERVQRMKLESQYLALNEAQSKAYDMEDVERALELALKKSDIFECAIAQFEIAQLYSYHLSPTYPEYTINARHHFQQAQKFSFNVHLKQCDGEGSLQKLGDAGNKKLFHEGERYTSALRYVDRTGKSDIVALWFESHEIAVMRIRDVTLHGNDGLLTRGCDVFIHSSDYFMNLDLQLRLNNPIPNLSMPRKLDKVVRLEKAVSLLQYASSEYYHFTVEILGRLIVLLPLLKAKLDIKIIAPIDYSETNFIQLFLEYFKIDKDRFIYYDTKRNHHQETMRVDTLFYTYWYEVKHQDPLTHTTPKAVLQRIHAYFKPDHWPPRIKVIFVSRHQEHLVRRWDGEDSFLDYLTKSIDHRFSVEVFNGEESVSEMLSLFQQARIVIGVHGAGLSNILFSPPGIDVIEFGFKSSHARHYAHISAALGHNHNIVEATPGPLGIAAEKVEIERQVLQTTFSMIQSILKTTKDEL